jgi:peptidoglycan/xylan/chitin deacetylase (PgdA/CDA1 family)
MSDDVLATEDPVVVMYHYVRDPRDGRRQPPHLATVRFERQVEELCARRIVVTPEAFFAWLRSEAPLPPKAALLTFDDGFSDHYRAVHPILAARGLKAAFYPNSQSVLTRNVLPVHKLQFIIADIADPAVLLDELLRLVAERGISPTGDRPFALRLDGSAVSEIKRLLQRDLPRSARTATIDALFRRHVTQDEQDFAGDLYVTKAELMEMSDYGHHVGNHGGAHERYSTLSADEQAADIDCGLELIRAVSSAAPHSFCFPYGEHDDGTIAALRERGCVAAFGTMPAAVPCGADPLRVPRYDCVDIHV